MVGKAVRGRGQVVQFDVKGLCRLVRCGLKQHCCSTLSCEPKMWLYSPHHRAKCGRCMPWSMWASPMAVSDEAHGRPAQCEEREPASSATHIKEICRRRLQHNKSARAFMGSRDSAALPAHLSYIEGADRRIKRRVLRGCFKRLAC